MWIHEHFFLQAQQQPDHIAVVQGQEHLTYGELALLTDKMAAALTCLFGRHARIAFRLPKAPLTIALMLACLRAGMTYIPIDPKSPVERQDLIVADCEAEALVIDPSTMTNKSSETTSSAQQLLELPIRQLIEDKQSMVEKKVGSQCTGVASQLEKDSLAYILYTSGSTGQPKGVMITHNNAKAFVDWALAAFSLVSDDHVAVHAALHFDLPVFDIYVGLAKGATLYLLDEQTALFPEAFYLFLREQTVTVLYAVPSALTTLILRSSLRSQSLPHLRYLLYAGEEFHPTPLRALMDRLPHARVFNLYGPIETNVVTLFEVQPEHLHLSRIPIGYPIPNTTLFLIDDKEQIVEQGEGEIIISGPSVTAGYLHQPVQTQRSLCTIQVAGSPRICYRTGDFAYRDEHGLLHFRGRRDNLIKTRGFRVELGDVEATLMKIPGIAEVAVVTLPHPIYSHLLYAFLVVEQGSWASETALMQEVRKRLPFYMCPQRLFFRAHLPKTSTGKIARRVLEDELKASEKHGERGQD